MPTVLRVLVCVGLAALPRAALAVSYERTPDTRSTLPEKILNERLSWGADLSFGGDFVAGNVDQKIINATAAGFKTWEENTVYLLTKTVVITAGGTLLRDEMSLMGRYDRRLSDRWRVFAFTTHARNPFLRLDYRGSLGAGPQLDLKGEDLTQAISAALAYQFESYSTTEIRRYLRSSLRYVLGYALDSGSRVGFDVFFAPALNDLDSLRIAFFPYVETRLWKDYFGLKLQAGVEFDSHPIAGVKMTDSTLSVAITFHAGE